MSARPARYNPELRRHSWKKLREHHKECRFCGVHIENRQGRHQAEWHQDWTWPDGRTGSTEWATDRKVPKCPGPAAEEPTPRDDWPLPAAEVEDAERDGLIAEASDLDDDPWLRRPDVEETCADAPSERETYVLW